MQIFLTKLIELVIMLSQLVQEVMRVGLDKNTIVKCAAELANESGLDKVTLKDIAQRLGIRPPSLYNHIGSLDELRRELMLYGWREMEDIVIRAAIGISGYDALRSMCRAFYGYATQNKGVFEAMLWYNKYADQSAMNATSEMFSVIYRVLDSVKIPREKAEHLIRTLRGFLEGFSLLVNNSAFGHPADIDESFEISLEVIIAGIRTMGK